MKNITGKDVAALLHGIHTHAELLFENKSGENLPNGLKILKNPDEIVYREKDLLKVLKALGLPEPEWELSMSVEEWKKQKRKKK